VTVFLGAPWSSAAQKPSQLSNEEETQMQKITPFLWFDSNAEEAMNSYVSIFKNSKFDQA
jgi:hypothetical protein